MGKEHGSAERYNRVGKILWWYRQSHLRPHSDRQAKLLVTNWSIVAVVWIVCVAVEFYWPPFRWHMATLDVVGLVLSAVPLKWSLEGLAYRRRAREEQAILDQLERFSL